MILVIWTGRAFVVRLCPYFFADRIFARKVVVFDTTKRKSVYLCKCIRQFGDFERESALEKLKRESWCKARTVPAAVMLQIDAGFGRGNATVAYLYRLMGRLAETSAELSQKTCQVVMECFASADMGLLTDMRLSEKGFSTFF